MLLLPNVTTTDRYEDCQLGQVPTCEKILYVVGNNPVLVRVAPQSLNKTINPFQDAGIITPQSAEFQRIQGIQFKSAIPGSPAQVIAQLVEPGDVLPIGGTPFTGVISASGSVSPGGTTITRVTALPASPADLQIVSYQLGASYPGVEWLCIYNATTGYWDVIGGPPIRAYAAMNVTLTLAQQNLNACTLTLPNQGDYQLAGKMNGLMLPIANGTYVSAGIVTAGGGLSGGPANNETRTYVPNNVPASQALGIDLSVDTGQAVAQLANDVLVWRAYCQTTTSAFTVFLVEIEAIPVRIK